MTKLRKWILIAPLSISWACGAPEQATLDQFFRAAQSNDSTTVAMMSAVSPPGDVESWEMVEVTSRTTEPFTLPELRDRLDAAEKERDAAAEERKKYFTDNQDALEQIIPKLREDPEYVFRGKLAPVQEAWAKLIEDRNEKERAYQEIKRTVDREASIASRSVVRQLTVSELKGEIAVTETLVNLKLANRDEMLPFTATLRKYDLSEAESARVEPSRWVIVDIEGATPEALAAAAEAKAPAVQTAAAAPEAEGEGEAEVAAAKAPARAEPVYVPQELRGAGRVQILTPETKVDGDDVVTLIRARNASRDWITGFTVTEHWYDDQGNAVGVGSATHSGRFEPGQVVELELRTPKAPSFYQNQFEFTHANGKLDASVVGSFPKAM